MNQTQMESAIGRGADLVTLKQRRPFRVMADDYGLVFDISTGRARPPTPWHGPVHRRFGVVELYRRWLDAERPMTTRWIQNEMSREGVGTFQSSYILATFEFLSRAR